jgi:hypothetical protein
MSLNDWLKASGVKSDRSSQNKSRSIVGPTDSIERPQTSSQITNIVLTGDIVESVDSSQSSGDRSRYTAPSVKIRPTGLPSWAINAAAFAGVPSSKTQSLDNNLEKPSIKSIQVIPNKDSASSVATDSVSSDSYNSSPDVAHVPSTRKRKTTLSDDIVDVVDVEDSPTRSKIPRPVGDLEVDEMDSCSDCLDSPVIAVSKRDAHEKPATITGAGHKPVLPATVLDLSQEGDAPATTPAAVRPIAPIFGRASARLAAKTQVITCAPIPVTADIAALEPANNSKRQPRTNRASSAECLRQADGEAGSASKPNPNSNPFFTSVSDKKRIKEQLLQQKFLQEIEDSKRSQASIFKATLDEHNQSDDREALGGSFFGKVRQQMKDKKELNAPHNSQLTPLSTDSNQAHDTVSMYYLIIHVCHPNNMQHLMPLMLSSVTVGRGPQRHSAAAIWPPRHAGLS